MPQMHGQLMDVMPEQPVPAGQEWKVYRENDWAAIFTGTAIVYLAYSLNQYASLNEIQYRNMEGEVEFCPLDTNSIIKHFIEWILIPSLMFRMIAHFKFKDHEATEYMDFKEFYLYV